MSKSFDNKLRIIKGMASLMRETSLENVKTVDICREAGVSRQTFYRNFDDKFDAGIWFIEEGIKSSVRQIGITLSWRSGLKLLFEFCDRNRDFMKRLFDIRIEDNRGAPWMVGTLVENCTMHYEEQYEACTGHGPDSLVKFQIRAFSKMMIAMLNEWLETGDPKLSDGFFDNVVTLVPRKLYEGLSIDDAKDSSVPDSFF